MSESSSGGNGQIMRWGDAAQYRSATMPAATRATGGGVRPAVTLLNATADPFGSLAALNGIYIGRVFRSLAEVTDADRQEAWEELSKTVLNGPLEAVQFHFLIEGVTRAFTHQAVRSRFSFFAQESLRFAVVDEERWVDRQAYPPSLAREPEEPYVRRIIGMDNDHEIVDNPDYGPDERDYALRREAWDDAILAAQATYRRLVDAGVPAEDARGLMPHSIATRYHWVVSLRTLLGEAGKRLCTQAQFEWRLVMAEVVKAIRGHANRTEGLPEGWTIGGPDAWQFEAIADVLRPVCYAEGRCGFMSKFDRGCKIRDRVEANAAIGRPSSEWGSRKEIYRPVGDHREMLLTETIDPIRAEEWLTDPEAARVRPVTASEESA